MELTVIKRNQLINGSMTTGFRCLGLGLEFSRSQLHQELLSYLKQKFAARNSSSLFHLKLVIKEVWIKEIIPEYCEKLCLSIPGRTQAVLKNKGLLTKY